MKRTLLFIFLVFILPLLLFSGFYFSNTYGRKNAQRVIQNLDLKINPRPQLSPLHTFGKDILDGNNNPVILRGVNLVGFNSNDYEWYPKTIDYLKKTYSVNVIRIRLVEDEFVKNEAEFFENLEGNFLYSARKNEIYVIFSPKLHDTSKDLGNNITDSMWKAVAGRYKNDPLVLYDLLPEPHDTTFKETIFRYTQLINEVRVINPGSLIFVSGLEWGREINYYADNPLPFENIIYRSNPYNEEKDFERLFGKVALKYPVFIGEFGADGYPYMSREAVSSLVRYLKDLGVGWTAWNYYDNGCPCILSDKNNYTPSLYGDIILNNLRSN